MQCKSLWIKASAKCINVNVKDRCVLHVIGLQSISRSWRGKEGYKCKMKGTKDQVLINKVNSLFPNAAIRRKAMQRLCFSTTWHCTASCCLRSIFIIWLLCLVSGPAFASLVIYTICVNQWAELNRQRCRSRRWCSSAEAMFRHTITS